MQIASHVLQEANLTTSNFHKYEKYYMHFGIASAKAID